MTIKDFNPLNEIGFYVGRTHRTMLNTLNQRLADKNIDITGEQAVIIMRLSIQDGMTQQELSDAIFKEKSSTKRLIDSLERKNLIVRIPDQNDRRSKRIHLTHGGKAIRVEMAETAICLLDVAKTGIDEKELEICKKVLTQVFDNLVKHNQNK